MPALALQKVTTKAKKTNGQRLLGLGRQSVELIADEGEAAGRQDTTQKGDLF
jgi:hypothetical protein